MELSVPIIYNRHNQCPCRRLILERENSCGKNLTATAAATAAVSHVAGVAVFSQLMEVLTSTRKRGV